MNILRRSIQVIATFLTNSYLIFPTTGNIYKGPLKVLCSPGLNCYSCPAATTYCPIGSLQQLLLGIRYSLEMGSYYVGLYVIGSIGIIGSIGGRFTCGWLCPFGLLQELIFRCQRHLTIEVPNITRYFKYIVLLLLVIVFPIYFANETGVGIPWFCKYLCPAGTIEAGIPMLILQPDLRSTVGLLFYNKLFWAICYVVWSGVTSRPFCKTTCPLGAFYGLFNRYSLIRLHLDTEKCTQCGACKKVCPMGIQFSITPNSSECIMCLKCLHEACHFDAISIRGIGLELQSNARSKLKTEVG